MSSCPYRRGMLPSPGLACASIASDAEHGWKAHTKAPRSDSSPLMDGIWHMAGSREDASSFHGGRELDSSRSRRLPEGCGAPWSIPDRHPHDVEVGADSCAPRVPPEENRVATIFVQGFRAIPRLSAWSGRSIERGQWSSKSRGLRSHPSNTCHADIARECSAARGGIDHGPSLRPCDIPDQAQLLLGVVEAIQWSGNGILIARSIA